MERIRINGKSLSVCKEPSDFKVITIPSADFARSTERFMNELFLGAFSLTVDLENACGYIDIAPHGFAYFMKLLLFKLRCKFLAKTEIICTEKEVRVTVSYGDAELPLETLTKIVEDSGFKVIESSPGFLALTTAVTRSRYLVIYNPAPDTFAKYLYEVFFM